MALKYDIQDCFCLKARRAARLLTQRYDEALSSAGMKATQFQLLAAIRRMEPTAHQALADKLGMDRTTLTRNLNVLVRDALVRVGKDPADKRGSRIALTEEGRLALDRAWPLWQGMQRKMLRQEGRMRNGDGKGALRESKGTD